MDFARKKMLETSLQLLSQRLQHVLETGDAPTLIHCHDPLASVASDVALRRSAMTVPIIQTVHGPWSREVLMGGAAPGGSHVSYIRELETRAFAATAHLIAVDHGQAEILTVDFDVPTRKITVVPNGIDTAGLILLAETAPRVDIREPYFLVPRRLVKKNGVEVALRAIASLRSSAVLVVAGDGPLRAQLQRTAAALNISKRVRFLGNLPPEDLLPLMRGARGVLIPSVPVDGVVEATSLAAMESMACGTPLLASDIGGLHEIVSQAGVGFLFPAGDDASLAAGLRDLESMSVDQVAALRQRTRCAAASFDVGSWFSATRAVYGHTLWRSGASGVDEYGALQR
jgi:glycosyltransferase involved in cell wall biosynthesis